MINAHSRRKTWWNPKSVLWRVCRRKVYSTQVLLKEAPNNVDF